MGWIIGIVIFFTILVWWILRPNTYEDDALDEMIRLDDELHAAQSLIVADAKDALRKKEQEDILRAKFLKKRQKLANVSYIDSIDDIDVMIRRRREDVSALQSLGAMDDVKTSSNTLWITVLFLIGAVVVVEVGVIASPILWWAACISIGLGLLSVLWFMLVFAFAAIISCLPSDGAEAEDEAGNLYMFIVIPLLLIVPAACILLVLWLLNLAPEAFSFLGASPISSLPLPGIPSLPLPDYYTVGRAVTWITIAILCAGPVWAIVDAIASLRRRIARNSETEGPE